MEKIDKNMVEKANQKELIQFRCSSEIKEKLQKLAEKEGTDVSKFVRKMATRIVTASERPVTPTTAVTVAPERNEWNKKAIQEMLTVFATIFGIILLFRLFSRI